MEFSYIALYVFLAAVFYKDVKDHIIPNLLSVGGTLFGLIYHLSLYQWNGLKYSGIGLLVGFFSVYGLYLLGALGAGDVKLFGAIGALMGIKITLYSLMYSIIYAGAIGIIILVFRREFRMRIGNIIRLLFQFFIFKQQIKEMIALKAGDSLRFPFMYAVLPGVITAHSYLVW